MDLVITINEKDLANNPGIMDIVKALALAVSGKTAPSSPADVMPAAPAPIMAPTASTMAPTPTMAPPVMQNPAPNAATNTTPIVRSR